MRKGKTALRVGPYFGFNGGGIVTLGTGGGGLSSIWGAADDGFLYFPALAANVFQDVAAAAPVVADNDPVGRFNDQSGKGRNATQGTSTRRPLWKANSGKPYLYADGSDDRLISTLLPSAAMSFAAAFRVTDIAVNRFALGGGTGGGSGHVQIGVNNTDGKPTIKYGSSTFDNTAYPSWLSLDKVVVVAGDGATWSVWIDGVKVLSAAAVAGAIAGTQPIGLCCVNENSFTGAFLSGRLTAAAAINRKWTDAEVARISTAFMGAF